MSIIQGGGAHNVDSAAAVFDHLINQSLRFEDGDSPALSKAYGAAQTNTKKLTISVWVKRGNLGIRSTIIFAKSGSGSALKFQTTDKLYFNAFNTGYNGFESNALFRDVSAWYHIVAQADSDGQTGANINKVYVNGVQLDNSKTSSFVPDDTATLLLRNGVTTYIGDDTDGAYHFDGYLAEMHVIDGSVVAYTEFGETKDGVWIPKEYSGSHGTNGFYLPFDDSSAIGDDESANTNDFTPSNLVASDVVLDSPTNNFATLNILDSHAASTYSEGSLKFADGGGDGASAHSTIAIPEISDSDTYYAEIRVNASGYAWGISPVTLDGAHNSVNRTGMLTLYNNGRRYNGTTAQGSGNNEYATISVGDIFGIKAGNGEIRFFQNGTDRGAAFTGLSGSYKFGTWAVGSAGTGITWNFGQDSTFHGQESAGTTTDTNGIGLFNGSEGANNKALCTSNLPDITIGPGQDTLAIDNFETMLYAGNDTEQHIGSGGARHPQDTVTIAKSLRLNDDDSGKLYFDPSSDGNKQIFTFSAWVKRATLGVNYQVIFGGKNVGGNQTDIRFDGSDQLRIVTAAASLTMDFKTNRTFKSLATWYHIVVAVDTTDSTLLNRVKIYVDGVQETDLQTTTCTVNTDCILNTATNQTTNVGALGYTTTVSNEFDGYLAEVNFIDGTQLDPTYFGQVGSNGYWVPKTITGVTYGENGFRLNFADSSDLGNDVSGRNNDFTVITSTFSATDQVIDSPTQNFSTMDSNRYSGIGTFSEGNLTVTTSTNNRATYGTIAVPSSGKWYYEVRVDSYAGGGGAYMGWGTKVNEGDNEYASDHGISFSSYNEQVLLDGSGQSGGYGSTGNNAASNGDVYSVLLDVDNGLFYYAKNGTYFNSANPSNGTGGLDVGNVLRAATTEVRPILTRGGSYNEAYTFNFGQDPSFNGGETAPGTDKTDANGAGKFLYDVPTGFLALMDDNIPQTGIKSPDWVWIKQRNAGVSHYLFDSVRGPGKDLHSDDDPSEATSLTTLKSFDNQGFTVGADTGVNDGADTYVAWTWKAGGAPTVDNSAAANATPTAGSVKIDGANKTDAFSGSPDLAVTRLSANTTAGFSIVSYTGTGSNATVGHGLTSAPEMVIVKRRTSPDANWFIFHKDTAATAEVIYLNLTNAAAASATIWNSTAPTNSVFSLGTGNSNTNLKDYIAYCFHSVEGYCKVGSYIGNNSSDGTFVYTGFRPAWIMTKREDNTSNWLIIDVKRDIDNVAHNRMIANLNNTEATSVVATMDILSNGFKRRDTNTDVNANGGTYIYLAFAEQPFKFANAR